MSYKDTKLPFTTESDEKKVNYAIDTELSVLHETLKEECFRLSVRSDIEALQIAKVELAIELLKSNLGLDTWAYREELVDKL